MNLVRLALIAALGAVAWYALSIYAALPSEVLGLAPTQVQATTTYMCPAITNAWAGQGVIIVAVVAVVGAIVIAVVDLQRRVY